jgi:hypothetical protein
MKQRINEVQRLQKIAGIKENVNEIMLKVGDVIYDKSKDRYFKIEDINDTQYIFRYIDPKTTSYISNSFIPNTLPINYIDKYLGDDFIKYNK